MVFGPGLLATEGETHRKQRKMLNPVFSTLHMRGIAPIIYQISHKVGSQPLALVISISFLWPVIAS
jgi:cytochrome P450